MRSARARWFTAPVADAILFPGQGSQHDDMRAAVASARPDLLAAATELCGADPFERLEDGTRFVQPAIFCTSVVSWQAIRDRVDPIAFAGHSFGELAALTAAGAVDELDALRLVVVRARVTAEVAERVGGGMVALLGVKPDAAYAIAERCGLIVANDNCPGETVLSGPTDGLLQAEAEAKAIEGKARQLAVQGPFHSPAMADARAAFAEALAGVRFGDARRVLSCLTAEPFEDPRRQLAEALVAGVRWRQVLLALKELGATRFIEAAPGAVLTKMTRRTLRGIRFLAVDQDQLEERPRDPASVSSAVATSVSDPSSATP